jgi:hypothetical protein
MSQQGPVATDIVLLQNVGSWDESGSGCKDWQRERTGGQVVGVFLAASLNIQVAVCLAPSNPITPSSADAASMHATSVFGYSYRIRGEIAEWISSACPEQ